MQNGKRFGLKKNFGYFITCFKEIKGRGNETVLPERIDYFGPNIVESKTGVVVFIIPNFGYFITCFM